MRRAKREVRGLDEIRSIVSRAQVLHVGSVDAEGPFIVPMSFGFEVEKNAGSEAAASEASAARWTFWLHSAGEGRKADAWDACPEVALELDVPAGVITGDFSCAYSYAYESVMAVGRVTRVTDPAEKLHGLRRIMDHMAPGAPVSFSEAAIERVAVWRVDVDGARLTAKRRA